MNSKILPKKSRPKRIPQDTLGSLYQNIVEKYGCWRNALKTSWREYLSEIERNPLTGEWTKEVASHLNSSEETGNVEES